MKWADNGRELLPDCYTLFRGSEYTRLRITTVCKPYMPDHLNVSYIEWRPCRQLTTDCTSGAICAIVISVADTNSLVVIRDYRHRANPRDDIPNENPPTGSVGPNVESGFGDTHVMYPEGQLETSGHMPDVQSWQGWPVGWDTPLWNGQTYPQRLVSTLWTCIDLNSRQLASFPIYGVKG